MKSRSSSLRRCRPLLGTLVDISVTADDARRLSGALEDGFRAVAEVHALMSFHEPNSDVSRLNRDAARGPVMVDARTWTVLDTARHISEASKGLFDVTIASLLVEWGFLPTLPRRPRTDPTASWRDVELLESHCVRFRKPLAIDLGGIAKGFAVDQAIEAIRAAGVEAACVNAGGDLRVCGDAAEPLYIRYSGSPSKLIDAGMLRNEAAATSADADSRRRDAAGWVSPLVDPRQRRPCSELASVTVRAPSCMLADALTKVVHCDPERAVDVLSRFGAAALAINRAGEVMVATCNLDRILRRRRSFRMSIRLGILHKTVVYAVTIALALTGVLWMVPHFFLASKGDFGSSHHPIEPWAMRLHGAAAMGFLVALGSMLPVHVRRAWQVRPKRPNRGDDALRDRRADRDRLRALLRVQ